MKGLDGLIIAVAHDEYKKIDRNVWLKIIKSNGVMMDITRVPNFDGISSEASDLPIPEALEEALVMYVKGQLSEDLQTREYYLQSFKKKVARFDSTRSGGARIVKGSWVLR